MRVLSGVDVASAGVALVAAAFSPVVAPAPVSLAGAIVGVLLRFCGGLIAHVRPMPSKRKRMKQGHGENGKKVTHLGAHKGGVASAGTSKGAAEARHLWAFGSKSPTS